MSKIRVTLDSHMLDLIDDALSYYHMAEMGGGSRDTPEDHKAMMRALRVINAAREKVSKP